MTLAEIDQNEDADGAGRAGALVLRLDGFAGSLDLLLDLARTHRIDLRSFDLLAVVEHLLLAISVETNIPLSRKADWTVATAWLLLLRSHLLVPSEDPNQQVAAAEWAQQLRAQLLSAQEAGSLARWLERRQQLNQDVFARGAPEMDSLLRPEGRTGDRVEFLWACIALFEGDWSPPALTLTAIYVPRPPDLYSIDDARERIRRHMAEAMPTDRVSLADLLPLQEIDRLLEAQADRGVRIRHRSAWSSTLMACLEMAKQGELAVEQSAYTELPGFRCL